MHAEYDALLSNKTCTLCPRPSRKKVVRKKWVFKLKQKSDGSIDRYKARLVAKGLDQEEGTDFNETFSPVIKPATIRLALALAVHFGWFIHQLDISNAFLNGFLEEKIFMEQPKVLGLSLMLSWNLVFLAQQWIHPYFIITTNQFRCLCSFMWTIY
jgi:hypothetical protein